MNQGEEGAKSNADGENQPKVPIARGTSHLEVEVNQMKTTMKAMMDTMKGKTHPDDLVHWKNYPFTVSTTSHALLPKF